MSLVCALTITLVGGVQTPYLRLKDNLDEPKQLGFCIDLKGWNPVSFTDAQAHSCKPSSGSAGGGTDEEFVPRDGAVAGRADASGRCLQAQSAAAGAGLDVPTCDAAQPLQKFTWVGDNSTGTLVLGDNPPPAPALCLAAGATLRQANSYWARGLELQPCATAPKELITWTVEGGTVSNGTPLVEGRPLLLPLAPLAAGLACSWPLRSSTPPRSPLRARRRTQRVRWASNRHTHTHAGGFKSLFYLR